MTKRGAFWSLNKEIKKATDLTFNTLYPSIRYGVSTPALHKKPRRDEDLYVVSSDRHLTYERSYIRSGTLPVKVQFKVLLLLHGTSDSRRDMSFETLASSGYVSGLGRFSLAKVISYVSHSVAPEFLSSFPYKCVDIDVFTSSLTQTNLNDLIRKYNIPRDFHPRLPPSGLVMCELPNDTIWIYHHSVITDPKSPGGSYSQTDVRRLSTYVVKLRDMPKGRLLFYLTPPAAVDITIRAPTLEDLAVATPRTKVTKHTIPATAHSSGISTRPQLFDENNRDDEESDNDGDACVEIPLITHIRSATTIPIRGKQSEGSVPSDAEGFSNRDPSGDAIGKDFFPSASGHYYASCPEDEVVASSYEVTREE
ncbi:hypothetical protein Tco_1150532 [Tanacetum coccineum]